MRTVRTLAACVALVIVSGVSSSAQQTREPSSTLLISRAIPIDPLFAGPLLDADDASEAERIAEAQRWAAEFDAWLSWSAEWSNRRERGWFTSYRDRPEKPAPPDWLRARCEVVIDEADPLVSPCDLLAAWNEDPTAVQLRRVRTAAAASQAEGAKTIWWEHLHMDVLWPAMRWQSSVYGVVGMHAAATVHGRLQLFIAPGAMLLNVPARNGSRAWKLATNYGIGFRLIEFTLPGNRPAMLHLNLAKAWLLADIAEVAGGRTTDFVGFSITLKRSN
jgi:hypothetical protein